MILIADKFGQLANRLFVFAHFIGWGIEHGVVIANPAFDEYAQYFEGTADDPWCRYPFRPNSSRNAARSRHRIYRITRLAARIGNRLKISTPWIGCLDIGWTESYELGDYELGEEEHARVLRSRKLTLVRGWQYRDEASLHKHAHAIRAHFTPRPPHVQRIDELLGKVRASCDVVVGVHVRRGDYLNFMGGRFYYAPSVYLEVMSKVRRLFMDREVGFLVCSDEPLVSAFYSTANIHLGHNHLVEDLYSFARCDYLIGPPSTYTMWASYYGGVPLYLITHPGIDPALANFELVLPSERQHARLLENIRLVEV
jgi:hypothetical protein